MQEFKKGLEVIKEIFLRQADWEKLFQKSDFFNKYKHFIVVDISAKDEKNFESW